MHDIPRFASISALDMREAINIAIAIFSIVLCGQFAYVVARDIRRWGYRRTDWTTKLAIGLLLIFSGEFLRSSVIWLIIHTEGVTGNYVSDIPILMFALALICIGGPCVIRVMAPEWLRRWLWIGALVIVAVLVYANFVW